MRVCPPHVFFFFKNTSLVCSRIRQATDKRLTLLGSSSFVAPRSLPLRRVVPAIEVVCTSFSSKKIRRWCSLLSNLDWTHTPSRILETLWNSMTSTEDQHCIVLISEKTKTYLEFPCPKDAFSGVARIYEEELKRLNPSMKTVSYTIDDLYEYLDSLNYCCCLIFDKASASCKFPPSLSNDETPRLTPLQ